MRDEMLQSDKRYTRIQNATRDGAGIVARLKLFGHIDAAPAGSWLLCCRAMLTLIGKNVARSKSGLAEWHQRRE